MAEVFPDSCDHIFEPCAVLREPGKFCGKCRSYMQISKGEFKERFKRSFWSWLKEYEDKYTFEGYKNKVQRRRQGLVP